MEQFESRLVELEKKVDAMSVIVHKLYKTFLWTLIITVALFVLPLIGLFFAIPSFISQYGNYSQILNQ